MRYLGLAILVVAVCGCAKSTPTKTKSVVAMGDVPTVVMAAAQKKEPAVKFDKVIKTPDGIYEVQGKTGAGKIVEVEVSETGEVLKVE